MADFVDFYEVLGEQPNASSSQLRSRIDALYNEANANRDHRNPTKKREYQELLEQTLPHARNALLDDAKRARYDTYLVEAKAGRASMSFPDLMSELAGRSQVEEKAGLLGVQESGAPAGRPAARKSGGKGPSQRAKKGLMISFGAVAAFFIVMVIMTLVLKKDVGISLAAAAVVALLVWSTRYLAPSGKVSS